MRALKQASKVRLATHLLAGMAPLPPPRAVPLLLLVLRHLPIPRWAPLRVPARAAVGPGLGPAAAQVPAVAEVMARLLLGVGAVAPLLLEAQTWV